MLERPSFSNLVDTAWALFRARGWLILLVLLVCSAPPRIYEYAMRADLAPNLAAQVRALLGPSPTLSEDGWIQILFHMQLNAIILASLSVLIFGIFTAAAIISVSKIAASWQSGDPINISGPRRRIFPNIFVVWLVLIISNITETLAYSALYLPGLYLSVIWYVAAFAAADEGLGPVSALKRSMEMTRGFRWVLLVIVFLAALFSFGFGFFRASVLLPWLLDAGYEVQQWRSIDGGLLSAVGFLRRFVGIIVAASTYLVLKRASAGVSQAEVDSTFS